MGKTAKLSPEQIQLLEEPLCATAVTLMPDGSPHSTIVWVDTDGASVLFNTTRDRLKYRNLSRDPRVAVTVFDPKRSFDRTLTVRGRAELIESGAIEHIDKLNKKYTGGDRFEGPREGRVIVRVVPEQVT